MADVPRFLVRPKLRCFHRDPDLPTFVCGRDAVWKRPPSGGLPGGFFCAVHSTADDTPIDDEALFRLVHVTVDVLFAGVSFNPSVAQSEALSQLERAVEGAGGVINLHACRSEVGRGQPQPPVGPQRPGRPPR